MKEYVAVEDVLELQKELHFDDIPGLEHYRCRHIDPGALIELPRADVRENSHGRWVEVNNPSYSPFDGSPSTIKICSVCDFAGGRRHNFCPNCGSIMDGGIKHE